MDADRREVALLKELVELGGSSDRLDEDADLERVGEKREDSQSPFSTVLDFERRKRATNLVELQGIEEVVQLPVLLFLLELDVVLLESVKGELGLVVDVNLERLKQRTRERSAFEDWTRLDRRMRIDSRSA